jgi:hypothetical protein
MTSNILEPKDPSDVKDYTIDWSLVLTAEGETTIASSIWSPSVPSGLYPADGSPQGSPPTGFVDGMKTTIWLTGGAANVSYELTNTIVTGGAVPRTHQRTIVIPCQQR